MFRRFNVGANLRCALVIGVTSFLAFGCSNSGSSRPPGVNLTGIVDDGGAYRTAYRTYDRPTKYYRGTTSY